MTFHVWSTERQAKFKVTLWRGLNRNTGPQWVNQRGPDMIRSSFVYGWIVTGQDASEFRPESPSPSLLCAIDQLDAAQQWQFPAQQLVDLGASARRGFAPDDRLPRYKPPTERQA